MNFKEAESACQGCQAALAMPLKGLNKPRPDPDQDSTISCMANVRRGVIRGSVQFSKEMVTLPVAYYPTGIECKMFPNPDQDKCNVFADSLKQKPDSITIPLEDYKSGNF